MDFEKLFEDLKNFVDLPLYSTLEGSKVFFIVLGVALLLFLLVIILFIVIGVGHHKRKVVALKKRQIDEQQVEEPGFKQIEVVQEVRQTVSQKPLKSDGSVNVTLSKDDFTLWRGRTYFVGKAFGDLLPGTYTVLSTNENESKFYLRLGGMTKEYAHASSIVMSEGDQICAVSGNVVLR
jgi:hypothetical protein